MHTGTQVGTRLDRRDDRRDDRRRVWQTARMQATEALGALLALALVVAVLLLPGMVLNWLGR